MKKDELIQLLAGVTIAVIQVYAMDPTFSLRLVFARFWDWLARVTGNLANFLGFYSMHARANYYLAVNSIGN